MTWSALRMLSCQAGTQSRLSSLSHDHLAVVPEYPISECLALLKANDVYVGNMGKSLATRLQNRTVINACHVDGMSIRQIPRRLKISKSTVADAINRKKRTGSNNDRHRKGPPRKTIAHEDKMIVTDRKCNRRWTAFELLANFNHAYKNRSQFTVNRRLQEASMYGRVAVREPLFRPINKIKRLNWAKNYRNWTGNDFKKCLFTDESKFVVFGGNTRKCARLSAGEQMLAECTVPSPHRQT